MLTYLSPGGYVEEVGAGSRPIEGVGTAVAAFVGLAADGPFNTPTLVSDWSQFTKQFGEFVPGSYLAHAVFGYFANGGGNCYVVRVGEDGAKGDGRRDLPASAHAALGGYRVRAIDGGTKGNQITVEVATGAGLEAVDEITMVCVPDLLAAYQQGMIDLEAVQAVQQAMITHCELMGDRIAILDPPPGLNAQQIKEWRQDKSGYDSKYAAMYWPWVRVFDPTDGGTRYVPPSGHMAGIWGRNDDTRGVHKAPANEVIRGALALELQTTKAEHDLLNPVGINCLRAFPGRGIRVWGGASTLSSEPAWRYLSVRRLFNYLEESILNGTRWVGFEPNDHALWAKIRRTITAFLVNEWRKGALFGLTPAEAFYVKCDEETNPAEGIDAGQVVCEIGVAPVKPAEFAVFRLAQFSGGTSLVNE